MTLSAATLVLDTSSPDGGLVGYVDRDGAVLGERAVTTLRSLSGTLPSLVAALSRGLPPAKRIAVIVGPGSFTGCRAALAFAHGVAIGGGLDLVGVTVGEAIRAVAPSSSAISVAIRAGDGRVFLDRDGVVEPFGLDALPASTDGIGVVAGDAAEAVARRLGLPLASDPHPTVAGIALAADLRARRLLPPLVPLPFYVDPPRTTKPPDAAASRPPPAG